MTRLDEWLKSHGVSRMQLARDAQIDLRTVSSLCEGRRDGNMATWREIARALGCTLDEIAPE